MKHFLRCIVSTAVALAICLSVVVSADTASTTDADENPYIQTFGDDWEKDGEGRN